MESSNEIVYKEYLDKKRDLFWKLVHVFTIKLKCVQNLIKDQFYVGYSGWINLISVRYIIFDCVLLIT